MILCHNVTPVNVNSEDHNQSANIENIESIQKNFSAPSSDERVSKSSKREFQASSPDEVALVKFAE